MSVKRRVCMLMVCGVIVLVMGSVMYAASEENMSTDGEASGTEVGSVMYYADRSSVGSGGVWTTDDEDDDVQSILDRRICGADCATTAGYSMHARWLLLHSAIEKGDLECVQQMVPAQIGFGDRRAFSDDKTPYEIALAEFHEASREQFECGDEAILWRKNSILACVIAEARLAADEWVSPHEMPAVVDNQREIIAYLRKFSSTE